MKHSTIGAALLAVLLCVGQTQASIDVGIFCADYSPPVTELNNLGLFNSVTSTYVGQTPTLAQLLAYDSVLAYTNYEPSDPTAFGNVLADYVDAGGHLVISTYGFSSQWAIEGRITNAGYAPLTKAAIGDVSGNLVATAPGDPIFSGVDLSGLAYFHNGNFAHPGLDPGATLLATDGNGINMIARNASGNVVGLNLFPASYGGNNAELYQLVGNALLPNNVPEPTTLLIWSVLGAIGLFWTCRR